MLSLCMKWMRLKCSFCSWGDDDDDGGTAEFFLRMMNVIPFSVCYLFSWLSLPPSRFPSSQPYSSTLHIFPLYIKWWNKMKHNMNYICYISTYKDTMFLQNVHTSSFFHISKPRWWCVVRVGMYIESARTIEIKEMAGAYDEHLLLLARSLSSSSASVSSSSLSITTCGR